MKPRERSTAFFAALLIAFGISGLDLENPALEYNQKEYIAIGAGIILMIIFYVNYRRNRTQT